MNYSDIPISSLTDQQKDEILHCLFFCLDAKSSSGSPDLTWLGGKIQWTCVTDVKRQFENLHRRRQQIEADIVALQEELEALK